MPLKRKRRRRSTVRGVTALVPPSPRRSAAHTHRQAYLQFYRGDITHRELQRIGGI